MEVTCFETAGNQANDFVRFPYDLYREDPRYIPPSRHEQRALLDAHSGYFAETHTRSRHFLACQGRRVIGRTSAFFNPLMKSEDGKPVGCVGLFECRPDEAAATALLLHATRWLQLECGARRIWGPLNGSIWHGYRFLTKGFDDQVFVGEPYNPPYYPSLFEQFGFRMIREWDSLFVQGRERIETMIARGRERLSLLQDQGFRLDPFLQDRREEQLRDLWSVLCSSYQGFLGFTPISLAQFTARFKRLEPVLDPDLFVLTYDPHGTCVGFAAAIPDFPGAARAMAGRDHFLGRWAWARHVDRHPRLNFYLGGITPEAERAGFGLGRAGLYYIIRRALEKGYDTVMLTLRAKGNRAHALAARSGLTAQHEYALFEYDCHD
jgi:hypothetical protein